MQYEFIVNLRDKYDILFSNCINVYVKTKITKCSFIVDTKINVDVIQYNGCNEGEISTGEM